MCPVPEGSRYDRLTTCSFWVIGSSLIVNMFFISKRRMETKTQSHKTMSSVVKVPELCKGFAIQHDIRYVEHCMVRSCSLKACHGYHNMLALHYRVCTVAPNRLPEGSKALLACSHLRAGVNPHCTLCPTQYERKGHIVPLSCNNLACSN